jgi:hypothetical protein
VLADPDRPRQLGKPGDEARDGHPLERLEPRDPRLRLGRAPLAQLRRELQQPREAVRPLEADPALSLEVGDFGGEVRRREAPGERGTGVRRERSAREEPRDPGEQPVAVDRGVPVVAAEERRRQLARRPHVGVAAHHVGDLVGVLLVDAGEREPREACGHRRVD